MKLIVGLGNPGKEYENTRHNIGFNCLDHYLKHLNITDKWSKKNNGLIIESFVNNEKVIFLKPQTYMNLSGDSVRKTMDYYNIDIDDLLVISDDLDLMTGNFKLKNNGSCGGHNGLRDIESKIGSSNYKRLKIGISNNKDIDTKDYVLGNISKEHKEILDDLFDKIDLVLDDYFKIPFGDLMSKYNQKNK